MNKTVYVVEALRFGDRERHSYIVGVYSKKHAAQKAADLEEAWRGGNKYFCEVSELDVDAPLPKDKLNWYTATERGL